jgi:hypothetical protein
MTERALTREQIFETFQPEIVRREPRQDRAGKEDVPPFVDFVEFRDKQGTLRYAINAAYYEGPLISGEQVLAQARAFDIEKQRLLSKFDRALDRLITKRASVASPKLK